MIIDERKYMTPPKREGTTAYSLFLKQHLLDAVAKGEILKDAFKLGPTEWLKLSDAQKQVCYYAPILLHLLNVHIIVLRCRRRGKPQDI